MKDRELFDLMWQAASRATDQCIARGLGRADKITRDSARAASDEVYRQYREHDQSPAHVPAAVHAVEPVVPVVPPVVAPVVPVDDAWSERADLN
jgi:hypothetical protein